MGYEFVKVLHYRKLSKKFQYPELFFLKPDATWVDTVSPRRRGLTPTNN